jgi:hypothetical protein
MIWEIVHEYLFLSSYWMDITNLCLGLLYLLLYFFMHPIDSHHNTTFILKLTGSNISLWYYFWIDFCLNIFRNMLSGGFQHSVRQRALWKTYQCWNHTFQRSQIISSSNPARYTVFSPLLDFSGSAGFGTWRIFVPLFWATCRLFSSFHCFGF